MRRAYREMIRLLRGAGGAGRPGLALLLKVISAHLRPGLIPPPASPILATLEITRRCNLRCTYCETCGNGPPPSLPGWMTEFVREAGRAGVLGVGFTGGEPLLLRSFESLARAAHGAGLLTHLNTNGTLVTPDRARSLLETGLSSINISLDAAGADIHDRLRGRGSFDQALAGIEALVRARAASGTRARLLLAMTLSEENASGAPDLPAFARELGVDGCTYLPLSRFSRPGGRTRAPSAARAAMELLALEKDPLLDNSGRYLKGMIRFFQGAPMPGRCSALHSSILVSSDRKLYPCVPSAVRGLGGEAYRPGAIMDALRSGVLKRCLDEALCRDCWWNCHRELDLALGVL